MVAQIKGWEPQASGPGGFADESALVAGLRAGTPEAFEALHAAYARGIYSLALRIVDDPHEAEDVAQEVLVKVLRGLPPEKGRFKLPAWLYRVTVNAAFDHVRARKRRPVTVAEENAPELASPVDEFERTELAHRVESTLKELPKRQQLALVLRDVHGLSVGETASVLGVTRPSADVLLSRARASFRRLFLAGVRVAGRCAEADRILAGGVGGGISTRDRARLKEHAKSCPDCRRTVELWGFAPAGLGLLLPQVALPAKLSLVGTLAAAKAAGVALPVGLGAAAAAGAVLGSGPAAGSGAAAAVTQAAASGGAGAATAAGATHGLLETLGSAAGVKIATLAAIATAALGVAEVTTHQRPASRTVADTALAAAGPSTGGPAAGAGASRAAGRHVLAEGPGPGESDHARTGAGQQRTSGQPSARTGDSKEQRGKRDAAKRRGRSHGSHGKSLAAAAGRGGGQSGAAKHTARAPHYPGRGGSAAAVAAPAGRSAGSSADEKDAGENGAGGSGGGQSSGD